MILVVDSGSTKTDWIALNDKGEEIKEKTNWYRWMICPNGVGK